MPAAPGAARSSSPPQAAAALVLLGWALLQAALLWLAGWPSSRRLWGDELMYRDLAARWARGETAELDPLWPPLYVSFLTLGERLGRPELWLVGTQAGLLLVAAWALYGLGVRFTGSPRAALWAAGLFLLDPQVQAFAHYCWPEALHLALFLGLVLLLSGPGAGPARLTLSGLLLGLCLLTKSLLLPFVPLLLLPLVLRVQGARVLRALVLVLVPAALVVAPTVVANGLRHGAYVIADSSRFNLWVGLNDRSRRNLVDEIVGDEYLRYRDSAPTLGARNAVLNTKLSTLVAARGLGPLVHAQLGKQYFRLFDKDSFFTDQLPGGAIAARGYGYSATPPLVAGALRALSYALYALTLVACACGLCCYDWRQRPGFWAALAFLAYNLLVFLGLHVKSRYRLQFLPVLELYAGAALAGNLHASKARWALAALVALLLVGLAFGGPWLP